MKKILLNFGDSWAHAGHVLPINGYSSLIAKELGYEWVDLSEPGTSIMHMVWRLQYFLTQDYTRHNQYLALFFVTAQERQLMFDVNGSAYEVNLARCPGYYKEFYTDHLGNFHFNCAMLTLQRLCDIYNIEDHYLLGWQLPVLWSSVDEKKFYKLGKSNAVEMFGGPGCTVRDLQNQSHPCVISRFNGHPSMQGHRTIAKHWIQWITNNS